MKKPLFITLLVLVCFALISSMFYFGYIMFNYSQSINDYNELEAKKAQTIQDGKQFINKERRLEDFDINAKKYLNYKSVYIRDNIYFLSNVEAWDKDMLSKLADELYQNKHGEEIKYVSSVILNPGLEGDYIGSHQNKRTIFDIPIKLFDFLPNENFNVKTMLGEINLYEADTQTTISDMALVLSHEYGHHFTDFHFGLLFNEYDKETEYYKLRVGDDERVLLDVNTMDEYIENHMWYLVELAAEDYVYFLGSENAHRTVKFYDTVDKVGIYARGGDAALDKVNYAYKPCRNGEPHENIVLGLPSEVEALQEYFYSFIDDNPPEYKDREPLGTLNLKMKKTNAKEHTFTWDQPYKDKSVLYTIILYDENDEILTMLRTRNGNEKGIAQFGYYNHKITKGNYIYTYSFGWDYDLGTKMRARVTASFPDGSIMISDPYDFEYWRVKDKIWKKI